MSENSPPSEPSEESRLAERWEQIRKKFAMSPMVDTKLSSLAQNAEAADWPLSSEDETPSKYIDFTYEELKLLPELAPDPSRIRLLIDILHETLSFDDPFGDMAEQIEASTGAGDGNIRKVLNDLGIPEDYPIALTTLSDEAMDLCHAEGIENLGQFADFAQNMAQNLVIGGDFRNLLNSIHQSDEEGISHYLPFRQNQKGLHVPEAFGMVVRQTGDDERRALLKRYGKKSLPEPEEGKKELSRDAVARLESRLQKKIAPILVWFGDEREKLRGQLEQGENLERYFMVLNDPDVEFISIHLLKRILQARPSSREEPESGLWGRITGIFRR